MKRTSKEINAILEKKHSWNKVRTTLSKQAKNAKSFCFFAFFSLENLYNFFKVEMYVSHLTFFKQERNVYLKLMDLCY